MAYENQDKCCGCGISIPHVHEDTDAMLCDTCYEKAEQEKYTPNNDDT